MANADFQARLNRIEGRAPRIVQDPLVGLPAGGGEQTARSTDWLKVAIVVIFFLIGFAARISTAVFLEPDFSVDVANYWGTMLQVVGFHLGLLAAICFAVMARGRAVKLNYAVGATLAGYGIASALFALVIF